MPPIQAQLAHYRDPADGRVWPFAFCRSDENPEPLPVIINVSPGAINSLDGCVRNCENVVSQVLDLGHRCVALRPTGRGPGSVYQNQGEVDVFAAIEALAELVPIDRDRICVTGCSMGGAATFYLASHYPDYFAAAAPLFGYCDYRLWDKPGGLTFHMSDWEEPSWLSRSAVFFPENFLHTPMYIAHGAWDRAIAGGVPTAHSEQMMDLLDATGCDVQLRIAPKTGHGLPEEFYKESLNWMLQQKKERHPKRISFGTASPRHASCYGFVIEQFESYGSKASLDFQDNTLQTSNIRLLSFPASRVTGQAITVDGQSLDLQTAEKIVLQKSDASWKQIQNIPVVGKAPECSGPFGDMFFDRTQFVIGSTGCEEELFYHKWMSGFLQKTFKSENGGVHRGGIRGENIVEFTQVTDTELSDDLPDGNYLLFGTPASNAVLARYADKLVVKFGDGYLELCGKRYEGDDVCIVCVLPRPDDKPGYFGIIGGVSSQSICWASHLGLQLLPDYLIFDQGKVLDWGFFDADWSLSE